MASSHTRFTHILLVTYWDCFISELAENLETLKAESGLIDDEYEPVTLVDASFQL